MRRRLTLAIAAVATASIILFALPLAFVVRHSYRDAEFLRLQRDATAATRQIDLDPTLSDAVELPESADLIGVYGQDGARREGEGPPRADAVVVDALATGRPGNATIAGRLVSAVPLIVRERITGAVRVSRDPSAVDRRVRRAWIALAGLAGLVLLGAVGAATIVARRLTRPLERVAVSARRLGEGDFTVATPASGIPEVDGLAASLEATARRLGDMVARDRTFSADASHQLRTPLAALRLEIESMELRPDAPPEVPLALEQVDRLQATIETLLALARGVPPVRGPLDLAAVAGELGRRYRGPLERAGRRLTVDVPTPPPSASGSQEIVGEILAVVVENAVRHGAGSVAMVVRELSDAWVAIEIGDEGEGIAGDEDDVFARRRDGGHGIGLALARSLAEAEGARLVLARRAPCPVFALHIPRPGPPP